MLVADRGRAQSVLSRDSVRFPGPSPPRYNATVAQVHEFFTGLVTDGMRLHDGSRTSLGFPVTCSTVGERPGLFHARCLTQFMGYPGAPARACARGSAWADARAQTTW